MCSFSVIKQTRNPKRSLRDKDLGNFHQLCFFFMASRNVICHAARCKACGIPLVSFCTEICPCPYEIGLWSLAPLGRSGARTVWAASLFMAKTCQRVSPGTNLRVLVFLSSGLNFLLLLTRIVPKELCVVCSSRTERPQAAPPCPELAAGGESAHSWVRAGPGHPPLPHSCLPKTAAFSGYSEAVILSEETLKVITTPRSEASPGLAVLLPCQKVKTSVSYIQFGSRFSKTP